ncbi:CRISPR-associated negative autoregulator [Stanieria sp. NIES-3757]|nr:CRISPR-associated negative autoregulator [Stanieria sp. NIES-3757]
MTFYLYGNILTFYGVAANNRGENQGNISTLQKLLWKGETHTKISAEAIRWAIRYYWQKAGYQVNRVWDDEVNDYTWQDPKFNPLDFIDDDLLGFFEAESAKKEPENAPNKSQSENVNNEPQPENAKLENTNQSKSKKKLPKKLKPKGSVTHRKGRLDVTRAISLLPYDGNVTFNAKSGTKTRTSIYGTEFHATRYQFGLGITPESCQDKSRVLALLDALVSICRVGGNHGRFLFDFAPESIVLRWTSDFTPRFLYCFEEDEMDNICTPELLRQIRSGDLEPTEFWISGKIAENLQGSEYSKVNQFSGIKAMVDALKQKIACDLQFCLLDQTNRGEN